MPVTSLAAMLRRSPRLACRELAALRQNDVPQRDARCECPAANMSTEASQLSVESKPSRKPATKRARPPDASDEKEESLRQQGFKCICGVDEAGRGPLAGPVVAACCVLPRGFLCEGLKDSKKLTEVARERLFEDIVSCPNVSFAIEVIDAPEIDRINILQATLAAMSGSIQKLCTGEKACNVDYVLVDGNRLPDNLPSDCQAEAIVKGDASCRVIAAASILAKVTRDRLMVEYDRKYPVYGFKEHKGYGTAKHISALLKHGPSPIHRYSFAPLKDWVTLASYGKKVVPAEKPEEELTP